MLWSLLSATFSWDAFRQLGWSPLSIETFHIEIGKLAGFKHVTILTSVVDHLRGVDHLCPLAHWRLRRLPGTGKLDTILDHIEVAPVAIHLTVNEHLSLSRAGKAPASSWTEISDAGGVWHGTNSLYPSPVVFAHVIVSNRKGNLCAVDRDAPGH